MEQFFIHAAVLWIITNFVSSNYSNKCKKFCANSFHLPEYILQLDFMRCKLLKGLRMAGSAHIVRYRCGGGKGRESAKAKNTNLSYVGKTPSILMFCLYSTFISMPHD